MKHSGHGRINRILVFRAGTVGDTVPDPVPEPAVVKIGTGTVVFATANTYTGATFINEGILNIRNGGALGSVQSNVQAVTVTGPLLTVPLLRV